MPLLSDALYYAEKVLMETWVTRHFRMERCTEQSTFTDCDDCAIVERRQHFYFRTDRFDGGPSNKECMERRFT